MLEERKIVKPKLPHIIINVKREVMEDVEWLYDLIYEEMKDKNVPILKVKQFLKDYHVAKKSENPDKALLKMYRSWVAIRVGKENQDGKKEKDGYSLNTAED